MTEQIATVAAVKKFFGMTMAQFKEEWQALSESDKKEIRTLLFQETAD